MLRFASMRASENIVAPSVFVARRLPGAEFSLTLLVHKDDL